VDGNKNRWTKKGVRTGSYIENKKETGRDKRQSRDKGKGKLKMSCQTSDASTLVRVSLGAGLRRELVCEGRRGTRAKRNVGLVCSHAFFFFGEERCRPSRTISLTLTFAFLGLILLCSQSPQKEKGLGQVVPAAVLGY
jgi:hypothetical protein